MLLALQTGVNRRVAAKMTKAIVALLCLALAALTTADDLPLVCFCFYTSESDAYKDRDASSLTALICHIRLAGFPKQPS